jgi:p-cumate 2,3-dioxygenase alpha subunit
MSVRRLNDDLIVDDRERGLFSVNRKVFVSPEILEVERERVFDRTWLFVGHDSEVPALGDFRTRAVAGRPLIMCRGREGEVRVLINSCTHRGAQVCRADEGNAQTFRCFYHAWTFDNRGALIGVPGSDGYAPGFRREDFALRSVPRIANYRGMVFISFDHEVEDFVTYLGGAKEILDIILDQGEDGMEIVGGTQKYSMRANWKLLVENSMDGYHLAATHRTYIEYLRSVGVKLKNLPGVGRALNKGHAVIEYEAAFGRPIARWEPRWGEEARVEIQKKKDRLVERFGSQRARRIADYSRNFFIYPNLIINDIMSLTLRTFHPVEPGYMEVTAWAFAPKGESPKWRSLRLDNFLTFLGPGGFATPDDVETLESCQLGFRSLKELEWSDISRGMTRDSRPDDEEQMRSFWRRWHEQMRGRNARRRTAA